MKILGESFAGIGTSMARIVESYVPEEKRLFNDQFAMKLLPGLFRFLLKILYMPGLRNAVLNLREKRMPGTLGSFICRTRYIDDILIQAMKDGIDQLVILGSGFDSRPYRIPGIEKIQIFEVDLPRAVKLKKIRVQKVLKKNPENVLFIGVNFETDNLSEMLSSSGFETNKKTLFIWEAVTQYISEKAVSETLDFVTKVSGPLSSIVFTYVRKAVIDGSDSPDWFQSLKSFAEKVGSPIIFGIDPDELPQFLSDRGLALVSDAGAEDYPGLFLNKAGRQMNVFNGERIAYARVK